MHDYRSRDLWRPPNLFSAARIPLGVLFPFVVRKRKTALAVLALGAATDVIDGWWARRFGEVTEVGAVIDGVADKFFAGSVVASLVAAGTLSPAGALLLASRELLELPLATRILADPRVRALEVDRRANRSGKIATTLELVAVAAVIVRSRFAPLALGAAGVCGIAAGISYWVRELRAERRAAAERPSAAGGDRVRVAHFVEGAR